MLPDPIIAFAILAFYPLCVWWLCAWRAKPMTPMIAPPVPERVTAIDNAYAALDAKFVATPALPAPMPKRSHHKRKAT